ncbi:hypothetical protein DFH08DRAFT_821932 [Mycena albidolilacea]|uniref:Uncharacterized protein n=1 Tax=Mycena albidolilacea TaxID=1033008 RepID=A0AAD6Z9F4_9AGAR|nr:hypothetical protein DFH08DRAFT_821932 [Mycena albidolilacea]
MADLEIRLTDGNKMVMKHESTTRDLSRPFVFHIVAFGPHASEAPGIQVHWLLPPVSSLTHLPSFNFIPTALHWALSGPVFCPVFPVLMSYAQTLTACNVHGKQRPAFTFLPSCPRQISSVADWMHSIPEPGNLFHTDVMARDDIHVMTKVVSTPRVVYLSGYHTLFDLFWVPPRISTYHIRPPREDAIRLVLLLREHTSY